MDSPTAIAQALHTTEGNSAYDEACKRLLSQKIILAWIMKSCLEEYRDLDVTEIAQKYIEGTPSISKEPVFPDETGPLIQGTDTMDKSLTERTVTYDISFRAVAPGSKKLIELYINVEAQGEFNPGYPLLKRGIYYCSRMISRQSNRDFIDSHYEKIKKVYSIWVCLYPPVKRKNTIRRYRMTEESLVGDVKEPVAHYDLLSVVMICLGGPDVEHYEGILKLLHMLLSNKTSETEKREVLKNEFDIPMTRELESEVSTMCNLSQTVKEEGRQEGLIDGILFALKNLMESTGMNIEQAMAALKLPEADRAKYRKLVT